MKDQDWLKISFPVLLCGIAILFVVPPSIFITEPNLKIVVTLLSMPLFLLLAVLIPCGIARGRDLFRELDFKPFRKSDILPVLSSVLIFFFFCLMTFLREKAGWETSPQGLVAYAEECPLSLFVLILFTAGILSPAAEELAYRRTVGGYFLREFPEQKWIAYLVTSFLFAISHGLIWQSIQLFLLALILQWQLQRGSLTRVILMHALFNWCSLTALILIRANVISDMI